MINRDKYFDNLKGVLIFLVVLGHFTFFNNLIPLNGAITNVIYSFHMPLFIFISGYFSKNIYSQREKEISNILFPYLIFQSLYYLFSKITGLGFIPPNLFVPICQNWYLIGLFIWRLLIPYFNFFDKRNSLLLITLFSLSIGFIDQFNSFLGLYRVLYFLPLFVIGYFVEDLIIIIDKYSKYRFVFIAFFILCAIVIFSLSYFTKLKNVILYAYLPYENYNQSLTHFYLRSSGFFSSIIISFSFLFLIPKRLTIFTKLGEYSMNIFLLHMFFVHPINYLLNFIPQISPLFTFAIIVVSSIVICYAMANKSINTIILPLTNLNKISNLIKNYR